MSQLIFPAPRRAQHDSYRTLLDRVDFYRIEAAAQLNPQRRIELGQFLTPPPVARLMASMFTQNRLAYSVLDAGAGVGSLSAALVASLCGRPPAIKEVAVTAFELDSHLSSYLQSNLRMCGDECRRVGIKFTGTSITDDFIRLGVTLVRAGLFGKQFNSAILNPPYRKISLDSEARMLLREIGVETSNLYTAFLSIAVKLLEPGGEMVAITPRSFCNGPYFRSFRKLFFESMTIRRIHVFGSRNTAFQDDEVLQENIIFSATKTIARDRSVQITSSDGPGDEDMTLREIAHDQLVKPEDEEQFIHIVPDDAGRQTADRMATFSKTLEELDLSVSTGRVVDFRAKEHLRDHPDGKSWPLIYPNHFSEGFVQWPKLGGKKPNAIAKSPETEGLLVRKGVYVLVKRFSSKEEPRRIVAAVYDPDRTDAERVGFENHVNYFHRDGNGLPMSVAKGLAAFLNSTVVDTYFRQFNGHTQVNATDLRSLRYPTNTELKALGANIGNAFPSQDDLDALVERELIQMAKKPNLSVRKVKKRIHEALSILDSLGLPDEQQNERSALSLLALLDLKLESSWSEASAPRIGITPMMDYFVTHYGKQYAPNSRETVRRFTIHQFVHAGIVIVNPDDPSRAINSPANVYQIAESALRLLRTFGSTEWEKNLAEYLKSHKTLQTQYAMAREMNQIPVTLPSGDQISLTQGGHNVLLAEIIEKFCPRFTPGGEVLYLGDTGNKHACFEEAKLEKLGITFDHHGKMPDLVIHYARNNWLILVEAVTSHGPVNPKRLRELKELFVESTAGLVFLTAFIDRRAMLKYLTEISWETEVWVADAPDHMIHFNGERFLGPYEKRAEGSPHDPPNSSPPTT